MKQDKRYSEAFKLSVLEEIKSGKWKSAAAAAVAYGLQGSTIYHWMDCHGYAHLRNRTMSVKTPQEAETITKLKAEIRKLKEALLDEVLHRRIEEECLRLVCGRLGTTPEEVKKKTGTTLP